MKTKLFNLFVFVLLLSSVACNSETIQEEEFVDQTPNFTDFPVKGGYQEPHYHGTTDAPYGHFLFTPESAINSTQKYPLLIFLHGYGERGNSQTDETNLNKILSHGPCKMIKNGTWNPSTEMFVASPQCHGDWWDRNLLKQFIGYLIKSNDQVDITRIYLTGLSMGGYATFDLLTAFGESIPIAAAVPICGSGVLSEFGNANIAKIPLWVFHGDADGTVSDEYSKAIVPAINELNPEVPAKLTIYPGVGHDSWTRTYDGSGMGSEDSAYDVFDQDIYTWMNQFRRD